MDINSVKQWTEFILNKEGRGYITPDQFNVNIPFAEIMFLADRLGLPEGYVPGRATGQEAYPLTFKIDDDVRPYLKSLNVALPSSGALTIPSDYLRRSSISSVFTHSTTSRVVTLDCEDSEETIVTDKSREVPVDILFNESFTDRKGHSYKGPTTEFPICTFYNYGIEFAPTNIGAIRFDYISKPIGALWGYDEINGEAVYSPSKSRQLQCPEDCYAKIVGFLVGKFGLNVSNEAVAAYGQELWSKGGAL